MVGCMGRFRISLFSVGDRLRRKQLMFSSQLSFHARLLEAKMSEKMVDRGPYPTQTLSVKRPLNCNANHKESFQEGNQTVSPKDSDEFCLVYYVPI